MILGTARRPAGVAGLTFDQFERYAEKLILQHLSIPPPDCSTFTKVLSKIDKNGKRLQGEMQFKFRLIPDEIGFPKSVLYHFIMISGGMIVTEKDDYTVNILNDFHFILRENQNVTLPPDTYSSSLIFEAIKRKKLGLPFPNPKAHLISPSQYEPYDLLKILNREVKWSSLKKKKVECVVSAQEVAHVNYQVLASTTAKKFLSVTREAQYQPKSSSLPHPSSSTTTAPGQSKRTIVPQASKAAKMNSTATTTLQKSPNKSALASTGTGIARTGSSGQAKAKSINMNKQPSKQTETSTSSGTSVVTSTASKPKPVESAPASKQQNTPAKNVPVATKVNKGPPSPDKQKQSESVPEDTIRRSTRTKDPTALHLPLQSRTKKAPDHCEKEDEVASIPQTPETSASRSSTPGTVVLKHSLRKRKSPVVADTRAESEPSPSKNPTAVCAPDTEIPDKESERCGLDSNVDDLDIHEGASSTSKRARSIGEEPITTKPGPDLKTPEKSSLRKSPRKLDFSPALSPPSNLSRKSKRLAKANDADCAKARDDNDNVSPQPVPAPAVNERENEPIVRLIPSPGKSTVVLSPTRRKEYPKLVLKAIAGPSKQSSKAKRSKSSDSDELNEDGVISDMEDVDFDEHDVQMRKPRRQIKISHRRRDFTMEEDILIIKNICKVEAFMYTGGKRLFELMSKSKDFKGIRSGDSLLERWRKYIKPKLLDKNTRSTSAKKWNISSSDLKNILEGIQKSKLNLHSNIAPDYRFD